MGTPPFQELTRNRHPTSRLHVGPQQSGEHRESKEWRGGDPQVSPPYLGPKISRLSLHAGASSFTLGERKQEGDVAAGPLGKEGPNAAGSLPSPARGPAEAEAPKGPPPHIQLPTHTH